MFSSLGQVGFWQKIQSSEISSFTTESLRKRKFRKTAKMTAWCHVWTAPCWQGFSERWCTAGRSCHVFGLLMRRCCMAAGPNALRRSGPCQKHALKRRFGTSGLSRSVGRLAWVRYSFMSFPTWCARYWFARVSIYLRHRLLVTCPSRHQRPGGASDFVGQGDGGDHGGAPLEKLGKPRSACTSGLLGPSDQRECPDHQQ